MSSARIKSIPLPNETSQNGIAEPREKKLENRQEKAHQKAEGDSFSREDSPELRNRLLVTGIRVGSVLWSIHVVDPDLVDLEMVRDPHDSETEKSPSQEDVKNPSGSKEISPEYFQQILQGTIRL